MNQKINLDDIFTEAFNLIKLLGNNINENIIDYIKKLFKYKIRELYPYDLLGEDLDYSSYIFENIIYSEINTLITNAYFIKLITSENFSSLDSLDQVQSTADNSVGYSGYSIENQDGQYMTNNSKTLSSGTNRLQALEYLRTYTLNWIDNIFNQIKNKLCRLIY